jgi:hypothetical protein
MQMATRRYLTGAMLQVSSHKLLLVFPPAWPVYKFIKNYANKL